MDGQIDKTGMYMCMGVSQVALVVRNPPANAGELRVAGSTPGSRRSPEGGNANPLQYSCLESPTDRGTWWATVPGVTKESDTTERPNNNMRKICAASLNQQQRLAKTLVHIGSNKMLGVCLNG